MLFALGLLTWWQAAIYRDGETLYRATLALNPQCSLAHNNLGMIAMDDPSRVEEAMACFHAAIRTNPRNVEAYVNISNVLAKTPDRQQDAIHQC